MPRFHCYQSLPWQYNNLAAKVTNLRTNVCLSWCWLKIGHAIVRTPRWVSEVGALKSWLDNIKRDCDKVVTLGGYAEILPSSLAAWFAFWRVKWQSQDPNKLQKVETPNLSLRKSWCCSWPEQKQTLTWTDHFEQKPPTKSMDDSE